MGLVTNLASQLFGFGLGQLGEYLDEREMRKINKQKDTLGANPLYQEHLAGNSEKMIDAKTRGIPYIPNQMSPELYDHIHNSGQFNAMLGRQGAYTAPGISEKSPFVQHMIDRQGNLDEQTAETQGTIARRTGDISFIGRTPEQMPQQLVIDSQNKYETNLPTHKIKTQKIANEKKRIGISEREVAAEEEKLKLEKAKAAGVGKMGLSSKATQSLIEKAAKLYAHGSLGKDAFGQQSGEASERSKARHTVTLGTFYDDVVSKIATKPLTPSKLVELYHYNQTKSKLSSEEKMAIIKMSVQQHEKTGVSLKGLLNAYTKRRIAEKEEGAKPKK